MPLRALYNRKFYNIEQKSAFEHCMKGKTRIDL